MSRVTDSAFDVSEISPSEYCQSPGRPIREFIPILQVISYISTLSPEKNTASRTCRGRQSSGLYLQGKTNQWTFRPWIRVPTFWVSGDLQATGQPGSWNSNQDSGRFVLNENLNIDTDLLPVQANFISLFTSWIVSICAKKRSILPLLSVWVWTTFIVILNISQS